MHTMAGEVQQGPLIGLRLFASADGADALRIVFMTGHADSAAYGGLFGTCRTGRDWVLTTAPRAKVALQLIPEQLTGDRWQRQLHAAQQALVTRGQPGAVIATALTLAFSPQVLGSRSQPAVQAAADSLLSFLQQAGQYVSDLALDNEFSTLASTSLLQRAGTTLGSIIRLTLHRCPYQLPPPSQLPSLRHLTITDSQGSVAFYRSVGAFLPQLTSFCHCTFAGFDSQAMVDIVRASGVQSHTLTDLTVFTLDDELVSALLDCCPSIARIQACRLEVQSGQHVGREWGLRELGLEEPFWDDSDTDEHARGLDMLARLPRPAAGAGAGAQRPRLRIGCPVLRPWAKFVGRTQLDRGEVLLCVDSLEVRQKYIGYV